MSDVLDPPSPFLPRSHLSTPITHTVPLPHIFARVTINDCFLLVLHLLVVLPPYQRRGLGTLLIREGLTAADGDNARTYIEASPKGLGLYQKFGWKEIDDIVIDMRPHGGTGMASEKCLMREPGAGFA